VVLGCVAFWQAVWTSLPHSLLAAHACLFGDWRWVLLREGASKPGDSLSAAS
jgi:hypothetical protein